LVQPQPARQSECTLDDGLDDGLDVELCDELDDELLEVIIRTTADELMDETTVLLEPHKATTKTRRSRPQHTPSTRRFSNERRFTLRGS
jgi:hypothetical protein